MIEDGQLLCNRCSDRIPVGKPLTRVLIEFGAEGLDRHYCEKCFREIYEIANSTEKRQGRLMLPRFLKKKSD